MTEDLSTATGRPARVHRTVTSYVRRSARMRPNHRRAFAEHASRYVLEVARAELSTSVHPEASLDVAAAFGREAPLVIEIGPGTGESLVPMAAARPDVDVLAFEVFQPAIARIVSRLATDGVGNVRVLEADAAAGLRHLVADQSVSEFWTFFPDPWQKARHHKRRLVSAEFAALAASRLAPGGRWLLATDWADYAEQMRAILDGTPGLSNVYPDWAPRPAARPLTRFEQRGLVAGRTVYDLCYRRD